MKSQAFIFIGRSGCGKGTQADLLMKKLHEVHGKENILHVETGALLREFIKGDSFTQKCTSEVVNSGGLLPEVVPVGLWADYLFKNYTGKEHLVFDGCPRKLHEAQLLDSALRFYKIEKPIIFYIDVSDEWAIDRLTARGRKDDTKEGVEKRMAWFESDVLPTINLYKNGSYYNFIKINGEQTPEEVSAEILASVGIS
ncbi:MAG: nucleoside monophosphate kinase [Candidatus Paceibacterota bacterium]|jgi:adenylate kinase